MIIAIFFAIVCFGIVFTIVVTSVNPIYKAPKGLIDEIGNPFGVKNGGIQDAEGQTT